MLVKLSDAAVSMNCDANSAYWQISLAKDSRILSTFITSLSFSELLFRISSTSP